jgi:DNA-binding SARP family transcriptional activator
MPCLLTTPKVRQVLALLILQANQVVRIETLIEELWGDNPPRSATTIVQTYICQLRKFFLQVGIVPGGSNGLVTHAHGYVLLADPARIDANLFEAAVTRAGQQIESGDVAAAKKAIAEALARWHGTPLVNVSCGRFLDAHRAYLDEVHVHAQELRIRTALLLGQHRELVAQLRGLVAAYPYHEWFHARLIETLYLSGRRSEALQAYERLRRVLHADLGLEPSPEVSRIQLAVLGASEAC